jgi:hypothetical protein
MLIEIVTICTIAALMVGVVIFLERRTESRAGTDVGLGMIEVLAAGAILLILGFLLFRK